METQKQGKGLEAFFSALVLASHCLHHLSYGAAAGFFRAVERCARELLSRLGIWAHDAWLREVSSLSEWSVFHSRVPVSSEAFAQILSLGLLGVLVRGCPSALFILVAALKTGEI